jgi:hypothetical protein
LVAVCAFPKTPPHNTPPLHTPQRRSPEDV